MAEVIEFRARKLGIRPFVRCSDGGVTYETRNATWLSWLVIVCTGFVALLAWPWLQWGSRSVTIPRSMITSVAVDKGVSYATLVVESTTARVGFRTDLATAEAARNVLLS